MGVRINKTKTNDKTIRTQLLKILSRNTDSGRIVEEFNVAQGKVRADVVLVSQDKLHAFEIKSDADTLLRLPKQIRYYNQVFKSVTLVVGSQHAHKAIYDIPDWWGLVIAQERSGKVTLHQIREAGDNPLLSPGRATELLTRSELIGILNDHCPPKQYWSMSKMGLVNELARELRADTAFSALSGAILARS